VADIENDKIKMDYDGEVSAFSPIDCRCIDVETNHKNMFKI